uniref:(northern house mosquito) hypothetical protein n=1 Tax=Culex pipiens TaxID=7175 RepID=A0A8D8DYF7_CULPI
MTGTGVHCRDLSRTSLKMTTGIRYSDHHSQPLDTEAVVQACPVVVSASVARRYSAYPPTVSEPVVVEEVATADAVGGDDVAAVCASEHGCDKPHNYCCYTLARIVHNR